MEGYELKFREKRFIIATGVLWIFISVLYLIMLIFYWGLLKPSFMIGTIIVSFELSVVFILGLIIGIYFLCLPSRTYIRITENELAIHKGLVWGNEVIKFHNIQEVRLLGNKMFIIPIYTYLRKEIKIKLDLIYMKDLEILLENFFSKSISVIRVC